MGRHGRAQRTFQPFCGFDDFADVDAGLKTHTVDHVQQVFRRHVARRRGGERATAHAAAACIEGPDAFLDGRIGVRHCSIAGVVEMTAQDQFWFKLPYTTYHGGNV